MVLKFCANLSLMFTETTDNLLERYQLASQAGFKAVEFTFPYQYPVEDVVKVTDYITAQLNPFCHLPQYSAANVDQILINAFPGDTERGELGLAIMSGRQDEFRESLEKSIEYARALNCNKIHVMAGKKFVGIVDTAMEYVYRDNLEYAARIFQDKGLIGLTEPISDAVIPNYFMDSFSEGNCFIPFRLRLDCKSIIHCRKCRSLLDYQQDRMFEGPFQKVLKPRSALCIDISVSSSRYTVVVTISNPFQRLWNDTFSSQLCELLIAVRGVAILLTSRVPELERENWLEGRESYRCMDGQLDRRKPTYPSWNVKTYCNEESRTDVSADNWAGENTRLASCYPGKDFQIFDFDCIRQRKVCQCAFRNYRGGNRINCKVRR
ncbi:hypothetical protein GHT06_014608 [Daphnia sinensis]|uniref:Xylose isomerase-like TIM barrel domain-containing protein n=1 Tax=Daphnia sinensis TaxID=1820382 RepID=A0AAD5KRY7_9CRUS|nr:hypothetical protein GHT06_014608 [Daphnia sinensis]